MHPLYTQAIDAQQKHKLRTAPLPRPAPARSAVNRTASVTTGHQAAQRSNHLHGKIEGRFPQVCCKSPLFLLHRARRSSFSPRPEKKKRGVHLQQTRCGCIPNKERVFQEERTPVVKWTLAQRTAPGRRSCPKGQPPAPARGQIRPERHPAEGYAPPGANFSPRSDPYISAFNRTGSTM